MKQLIDDLEKKQIFGRVAGYVYTIEFQKRGMPHMHLLIILKAEDRPNTAEEVDDFISAELPIIKPEWIEWWEQREKHPELFESLTAEEKKQFELWQLVKTHHPFAMWKRKS